ncbi:M20/M25/M40 family metallo-hydrolase [Alicyclobacillus pomorum]|jgi:tripeptide aminopeptidase|uniref:M20/M25/M40 family metallo-hydrolase n=1 Tax=Alicyclobacillus pomorum TaxID=204470 RepID=UPI0003F8E5B7|nr:M20/M25/M40 family metallo-hydrolase [Alicyclobacillus pomorum]
MDSAYIRNLFLELVQIDSHSLEEASMAKRCAQELESLGFEVTFDDAGQALGGNTGNLIAYLPGDETKQTVLLAAHMDTVRPGVGVKPRVDENGVVWSDGTTVLGADDKAGVTAILSALRHIVQTNMSHGPIQVVFTIAEEMGLQGAKQLDAKRLRADLGLSLDSGGPLGTVVVAGPTQVKWQAVFRGRAAHAGVSPERGISAIKVAAHAVSNMPHGRIDAATTVNIGSFVGQGPTNVVRDKVQLDGEARSLNPQRLDEVLQQIEEVFRKTAAQHGAEVSFMHQKMYDGFRFDEGDDVRAKAVAALEAAGFTPNPVESGGGSDANIYTSKGVPTINIGIGYEDIHSTSEHIALQDIEGASRVIVEFCARA